jgi:hypothetical protein
MMWSYLFQVWLREKIQMQAATLLLHAKTKDIIVEEPSLRIVLLEGFKLK